MSNLEEKLRFHNNIQVITIDFDGVIKDTDYNLFSWKEGSSIYEAHPFFEIIPALSENIDPKSNEFSFACVHLEEASKERICDITFKFDLNETVIILFEYTEKYKELNHISQQKNESLLKNKELELRNEFLLKKEEFKNSFISNINHEIKTPLTGILGFTEVLGKTQLTFEQEELIKIIKRESTHLDAIISDMLDISKIEAGEIKVKNELFDFSKLIKGITKKYKHLAKERDIKFEVSVDSNIQKELIGDQVRVRQILLNLLNNAFKFTPEGTVKLRITKNYQRTNKLSINFSIADSGVGIAEENLDAVFDRFSRFHNDRKITGTGLGLAISKNLVDLLKGTIKVSSKLNEGSTFEFNLPFKFNISPTRKEKKAKTYTLPELGRKFRVLLVEDKEINQFLITKVLISHGSFYVDVAMNGEDAIKYIEKRKYDIILMDIKMSPIDGYQATHMIRNNYGDDHISKVPIIGFTAKSEEGEREKCLKSGMDDFIKKPFGQEDLINRISKQILKKATS